MERICRVGSTTEHRYLPILRILSFLMPRETTAMLILSAFGMGGLQSPKAEAVTSCFSVLYGFEVSLRATVYVKNGLERRVPETLEEPGVFDEQILKPYTSSSLLLEVSQA